MPTPNKESLANANALRKKQTWNVAGQAYGVGITSRRTIYDIDYAVLIARFAEISKVTANTPTSSESMANATCENRRANHEDRPGHLLNAVPVGGAFCEYHVPSNGLPYPANIRLVYDTVNNNLYVTPSHYDDWTDNDGTTVMNPFFLLTNTAGVVFGGTADFS